MSRIPLTADDLDNAGCQHPGCTHEDHEQLWIHSRCHDSAPLRCVYLTKTKTLGVICAECGNRIMELSVARKVSVLH